MKEVLISKLTRCINVSQQDYEEQFNFLISVRDKFDEIQKAGKNIRDIRKQINDFMDKQGKDVPKEIKQQADTINKQMTAVEEALHQTKAKSGQDVLNYPIRLDDKISGLYDFAVSGNAAPARQVKEAFAELGGQADVQLNKLKKIMEVDVVKFNEMIREKALAGDWSEERLKIDTEILDTGGSSILHTVSNIQYRASSIQYPVSSIHLPASNIPYLCRMNFKAFSSSFINKFIYLKRAFGNKPFRLLDIGAGNHSATKAKTVFPNCEYHGVDMEQGLQ